MLVLVTVMVNGLFSASLKTFDRFKISSASSSVAAMSAIGLGIVGQSFTGVILMVTETVSP